MIPKFSSILRKGVPHRTFEPVSVVKARPKPRVIMLGSGPRMDGLIDLYRAGENPDLALVDRAGHLVGGTTRGREIHALDALDLDRLEGVVVTEIRHPYHYQEPIDYLTSRGVPPEKIATVVQPGKAHRILADLVNLTDPDHKRMIGYRAIRTNMFERCNYAYCMILAAESALRMSLTEATAIEFGVWFGAGLKNLCELGDFLHQTLGVRFRIFGFDTGVGLPPVTDWRDHPELWDGGTMVMPDPEKLRAELPDNCKLILGNCRDTLPAFLKEHGSAEAPIGFVSLDVDQYHSSVAALKVFEAEATHLMPAVPVWVDDADIGVTCTSFAGEGLAIREFNDRHELRKIDHKIVRTDDGPALWRHCIHFAHIFDHPVRQGKVRARFDQFYHNHY